MYVRMCVCMSVYVCVCVCVTRTHTYILESVSARVGRRLGGIHEIIREGLIAVIRDRYTYNMNTNK